MAQTIIMQSSNPQKIPSPVSIDSQIKHIFCKFNYASNKFDEQDGKYSFQIYFNNGFPGGDIKITSLTTNDTLDIKGYNVDSGVFEFPLDDILFEFTPYLDGSQTISKKFFFKNALNFTNQLFNPKFITDDLKDIIFNGYLKIAYNKSVSDFDAHIYFNDDKTHDLIVGCYSYKDFDQVYYEPKIKDFTIFKMAYNSPKLGILRIDECECRLWNIKSKSQMIPTDKIYYDLFFFYFNLLKNFSDKGYSNNPFRIMYENPIIQTNSLIIDFYY